jgi:hypothetical protein
VTNECTPAISEPKRTKMPRNTYMVLLCRSYFRCY